MRLWNWDAVDLRLAGMTRGCFGCTFFHRSETHFPVPKLKFAHCIQPICFQGTNESPSAPSPSRRHNAASPTHPLLPNLSLNSPQRAPIGSHILHKSHIYLPPPTNKSSNTISKRPQIPQKRQTQIRDPQKATHALRPTGLEESAAVQLGGRHAVRITTFTPFPSHCPPPSHKPPLT